MQATTPHRRLLLDAIAALGISSSAFLWTAAPLVEPRHLALYHWSGSASNLFVPVILNILAFTLFFTLLLSTAHRPGRWQAAVWIGVLLLVPFIVLKNWELIEVTAPVRGVGLLLFGAALAGWALLMVFWRRSFLPALAHLVPFAATLFVFLGVSGLCMLGELTWFGWQARGLSQDSRIYHPPTAGRAAEGRVIWILFDELSFQQVYEKRFPGVQLPAFDAVARQSTLFTHVVPAGDQTEKVLPSLITGRQVESLEASSVGLPVLQVSGSRASWHGMSTTPSLPTPSGRATARPSPAGTTRTAASCHTLSMIASGASIRFSLGA